MILVITLHNGEQADFRIPDLKEHQVRRIIDKLKVTGCTVGKGENYQLIFPTQIQSIGIAIEKVAAKL